MQLTFTITSILIAGLLVLFVPGASLLAALRLGRVVPPALLPAAALAMGFVPLALATAASLGLKQPIWTVTATLILVTLACWVVLFRRARTGPLHALLAGGLRRVPIGAALAALGLGALAISVGYFAWNDSAYHIGQAQKLLHLSAPSFTNTLQFPDGSAHPGYLLPLWQEGLAQVAFVSRQDPMEVAWILPGLTVATAALAFGGLLWTLTRSRRATTPGTVAWALVAAIGPLPLSDAIYNSMHPGGIALAILMPLVLAMLFVGAWPDVEATNELVVADEASPRTITRSAAIIAAVAVAGFGILHVSNLVILALGMLGYLAVWTLRAPWPRPVVLRHLTMFGAVALVAVICVGSFYPGLSKLESFGQDAKTELQQNESDLYDGKNGAPLEALLRGDVAGDNYHLRADYLVLGGGLSILALFALVAALFAPRWPAAWYFGGTAFAVLAIALTDQVFPRYVGIVSLDQARRIEKSLPLALGLGVASLLVAALLMALARRGRAWWIPAALLAGGAAWGTWHMTDTIQVMQGYGGDEIVEPRVLTTALALLGVGGLLLLVLFVVRLVRGADARARLEGLLRLPSWEWPTGVIAPGVGVLATALLLVGAWPAHSRVQDMWIAERLDVKTGTGTTQIPTTHRLGEMRVFSVQVARQLRNLPAGSITLFDPRSRDPYMAMALAPVYVVSSVPRHTANTPNNRVEERFRRAVSFYERPGPDSLSNHDRLQLLVDERIDAVSIHPRSHLRPMLESTPGLDRVAFGKNQFLFRVDRDTLQDYLDDGGPDAAVTGASSTD